MNLKHSIYISLIAITLLLGGCKKFLEDYSQDTIYVRSWKDLNETLIGDCYLPVISSANGLSTASDYGTYLHFMGDEVQESLTSYNNSATRIADKQKIFGYYTWQQRTDQTEDNSGYIDNFNDWNKIYRLINVSNNIIFSARSVPQNTNEEKVGVKKVIGEAYFLRAAYYFWLVNLYGKPYQAATSGTDLGVPIKISENVEDLDFKRNTVKECYDQILEDLNVAKENLAETGKAFSIYRADETAVLFLLSRVHLYMQNWSEAAAYADQVIARNPALVNLNTSADAILSKTSVENIFSMGGTSLPTILWFNFKSFRVSDDLYNTYETTDLRKTRFFWKYNDFIGYTKLAEMNPTAVSKTSASYYTNAYSWGWAGTQSPVSDKFLFRTAEAYLIKAEANAYLGNEAAATTALNTLRSNRYATGQPYEVTATGSDLVKVIRDERRKELALEGLRWFDLRRYMVCEKYPESKPIVHNYTFYSTNSSIVKLKYNTYTLAANDPAYTLPIPFAVTSFSNMPNNERPVRTYTVTNY